MPSSDWKGLAMDLLSDIGLALAKISPGALVVLVLGLAFLRTRIELHIKLNANDGEWAQSESLLVENKKRLVLLPSVNARGRSRQ
jgi:hypothetical protein